MEIAPGLDMKSISHKYYQECRLPAEQCATIIHEDWSSIFIPCLPAGFDNDEKLRHLIEFVLKLGEIKRIDYSKHATTGKPMAFIHFAHWNDTYEVKKFRHYMENMEYMDLEGVHIFYTSAIGANMYNKGNTDIKTRYDHWCKDNSIKPMKMGALYSALDDKFGKSYKCQHKGDFKNKWVYKGLSPKLEESNTDLDA